MDKYLTKPEFIIEAGLTRETLNRWLRQGKFKPADVDDKGKPLFGRAQIDAAKALHRPDMNGNKGRAKRANSPQDELHFDDDEPATDVDSKLPTSEVLPDEAATNDGTSDVGNFPETVNAFSSLKENPIDVERDDTADTTEPVARVINAADYRTILLHAEKICGGQFDFADVLKCEIKNLLGVDADNLVAELVTMQDNPNFLDSVKKFLAQVPFVVDEDGTRYKLVGTELELVDDVQNDKATLGQPDAKTRFEARFESRDVATFAPTDDDEAIASLESESGSLPSLTEPLKKENVDVEILPPENVTHSADVITLEERAARIRKLSADVARGIIEIGRELIAAKEQVGHGNWANWLKENFDWSQQTAENYMRVAERFSDSDLLTAKSKSILILNPTKLITLLALPEGDEEAFIKAQADKGRPIENQSSREIKAAVKDWKNQKTTPDADNKVDAAPNDNRGKISRIVVPDVDDAPNRDFDSESSSEGSGENESVIPAPMDDDNALTIEHEPPPTPEPIDGGDSSVITPDTAQIEESAKPLPPLANRRGGANYEWYTPPKYCDAVRQVLGAVDLDPTSCELANQNVGASKIFTVDDDTLNQDWVGRVFMNPPFTYPLVERLVDKFVSEYKSGNITAGIVLSRNATETRWFIELVKASGAILFTDHRINFLDNGVEVKGSSQQGQCFFYFGSEADKFLDVFKQFGWGVKSSFLQGLSFSR